MIAEALDFAKGFGYYYPSSKFCPFGIRGFDHGEREIPR